LFLDEEQPAIEHPRLSRIRPLGRRMFRLGERLAATVRLRRSLFRLREQRPSGNVRGIRA
jgi:hypothetical protein